MSKLLMFLAVLALGLVLAIERGRPDNEARAATSWKDCPSASEAVDHDQYSVGDDHEGLKLSKRYAVCDAEPTGPYAPPTRRNFVSRLYGTCTPIGEGGCPYPLEVQSWPACERNASLYTRFPGPAGPLIPQRTTIRGVPAAVFDNGLRIEVYTGDATVVVTATSARDALVAARRLTGWRAGRRVEVTDPLPAPESGAVDGELAC